MKAKLSELRIWFYLLFAGFRCIETIGPVSMAYHRKPGISLVKKDGVEKCLLSLQVGNKAG